MSHICFDCGYRFGDISYTVSTFHKGTCIICKNKKSVTSDRNFRYPSGENYTPEIYILKKDDNEILVLNHEILMFLVKTGNEKITSTKKISEVIKILTTNEVINFKMVQDDAMFRYLNSNKYILLNSLKSGNEIKKLFTENFKIKK